MYSEKATKFCKTFPLLLSVCTVDKSKGKFRKILWPSQEIRTLLAPTRILETSEQLVYCYG